MTLCPTYSLALPSTHELTSSVALTSTFEPALEHFVPLAAKVGGLLKSPLRRFSPMIYHDHMASIALLPTASLLNTRAVCLP